MGEKANSQERAEKQAKIKHSCVYQGKFYQVNQDVIEIEGHPPKIWDLIAHPGAVAILPINHKQEIILIEQWRRAVGKIVLEIPAGALEAGEKPLVCAQRELQEEIGYKAGRLIPFDGCYPAPGTSNEYVHLFIAKDLEESYLEADDTAVIDLKIVSLQNALKLIEEGAICDAKTIVAILRYASSLSSLS